jgi:hypothetical protein
VLVHLVAELSGVRIHRTGSSRRLSSDTPARRGHFITAPGNLHSLITEGGVGFRHPAALLFGTDLAPLWTERLWHDRAAQTLVATPPAVRMQASDAAALDPPSLRSPRPGAPGCLVWVSS